uniref:ADF-H domain-containing protein n=1 Tax=Lactuca sativa TaxID=4236 RepID=A0A9R1WTR3_LACSA|nr:hypothetical protein LSAT_V11C100035170 [Lactuca sativa]
MVGRNYGQCSIRDDCNLKFMDLKAKRTFRFIIYKIEEKQKQVMVEKLGEPAETYDDFAACLPADECRYVVFDFDFMTAENVTGYCKSEEQDDLCKLKGQVQERA